MVAVSAGTVGSPNVAASLIELLLAPCLAVLLITQRRRWRTMLAMAAFLAGGLALLITFSRGGWIAAIASVSLFCGFAWWRGWLSLRIPLTLAICGFLVLLPFSGEILDRLFGEEGATAEGRFIMMELAQRIIVDNPLLGVGANNFAAVMDDYIVNPDFTGAWLHTVHNKYLLVWAENGIVGLIAFAGFLLSAVFCGWQSWRSNDRLLGLLGLAFAVGILGQMLHMNLALFHGRLQVQLLWLVCGLLASIAALAVPRADA